MSTEILRMPSTWTAKPTTFKQRDYFRRGSLGRKMHSSCGYMSRVDESVDVSQHLERWMVSDEPSYNIIIKKDFDIVLSQTLSIILPNELDYLFDCIAKTKYILALDENWDDEGAERYSENTLKSSINFLIDYALWVSKSHQAKIFIPKITHGPDGSVDIVWEENDYRLVINIENGGEKASFYYDNGKDLSQFIEGSFDVDSNNYKHIPPPKK